MTPSLHFRPLRPAVAADGATTLDLLITVRSPEQPPSMSRQRPALNLALVIDRSGSMAGRKLSNARQAARFLAGELSERDRLAIVTFDGAMQVLVPSMPVRDPLTFISAINTIDAGGCTALFEGWLAGATEVAPASWIPRASTGCCCSPMARPTKGSPMPPPSPPGWRGSPNGGSAPVPLAWAAVSMKT